MSLLFFERLTQGGAIIWVLLALAFLVWGLIGNRYFNLNQGAKRFKERFLDPSYAESHLLQNEKIIKSLIAVAPLLGLLGTVGGMIETFSSLETMELFKADGGVAVGISQALLTTQMGLIVSVPALFLLKFVNKNKTQFLEECSRYLNCEDCYEIQN